MKEQKESIAFYNAQIRPFADRRIAEALLIQEGHISAVGTTAEILGLCDGKTKKIDLCGRTVLPGFYDSHLHLVETAKIIDEAQLSGVRSVEELILRGRQYVELRPGSADQWIFGRGWNQENLEGKRYPTRHDLDKISRDRPILFQRCCGIVGVLNTRGLELMGIDAHFSVSGGLVDKDDEGLPNGIVRREALDGWVKRRLPQMDRETARHLIEKMTRLCAGCGMTSAQSDDLVMYQNPDLLSSLYQEVAASGKLAVRVGQQYLLRNTEVLRQFIDGGNRTGSGGDRFYTGPLKVIVDGSLGSRTAALRCDYADAPGEKGLFVHSDAELVEMMTLAHQHDLQMAIHAIGDAATEKVLDILTELQSKHRSRWQHRIVHCQIGDKELYERMAQLHVNADVQPPFVASEWTWVPDRVGDERAAVSYAWRTLLDSGVELGGSSDSPVESYAPLWGIQTAVTRMDASGKPEGGWLPDQKLTLEKALRMYTLGSALVCGEADKKGTLEPGKWRDCVVLDEDPFLINPTEISAIPVVFTVSGGEMTHSDENYI